MVMKTMLVKQPTRIVDVPVYIVAESMDDAALLDVPAVAELCRVLARIVSRIEADPAVVDEEGVE